MRGQVPGTVAVQKARTIVQVNRGPYPARQTEVDPRADRVTLVMIEKEITHVWRGEIRETTGDRSRPFRVLMGICEVELRPPGDARGIRRRFPAADARPINRQREEDVRVSQD